MAATHGGRNRRRFSKQFKEGAVKLVTEQGYAINDAARRLEIDRKSLWEWIKQFAPDFDPTAAAREVSDDPKALLAENRRLRKEFERVKLENEILKKATAYFAKEVQ